ncbi:MAG: hypothetical protein FWC15_00985 [Fibromonadales bacterium]|nr:hypothetical protein [Fibromonadales bacterium]
MGANKAKLNLDFGHSGISMNFAKANDIQPRPGAEHDWDAGTFRFNTEEFEDFPGISQNKIDDAHIKTVAEFINNAIVEWQNETGCDFDQLMEITISAAFFEVLSFPYSLAFGEPKVIGQDDMDKIEECKRPEKMSQIPIPVENIRSLTSPYFTILNDKGVISRSFAPKGKSTKGLGFNSYFITKHPTLARLLDVMKEEEDCINISLSCEKEFQALAYQKEKDGKTLLIHITDFMSEFSVWEKSELKYLNKKESGFKELKVAIWRLCLFFHNNPMLTEHDYELTQKPDLMQRFCNMVMNAEITDDSKELLSADDCSGLLDMVSCILESETEESIQFSRLELPGKNRSKTNRTISNYVLCYFAREALRRLFLEIKRIIYTDDFCKPESIILECPLPLKGIDALAAEVFDIPARRAVVKWDGEMRSDLSSTCVGALQSLIASNAGEKKKTTKMPAFLEWFFSKAS